MSYFVMMGDELGYINLDDVRRAKIQEDESVFVTYRDGKTETFPANYSLTEGLKKLALDALLEGVDMGDDPFDLEEEEDDAEFPDELDLEGLAMAEDDDEDEAVDEP